MMLRSTVRSAMRTGARHGRTAQTSAHPAPDQGHRGGARPSALLLGPCRLRFEARRRLRSRPDDLRLAFLELQEHRWGENVLDALELHGTVDGIEGLAGDRFANLRFVEPRALHRLLQDLDRHP